MANRLSTETGTGSLRCLVRTYASRAIDSTGERAVRTGSTTVNVDPSPPILDANRLPSCRSIMVLDIESPRPVPFPEGFVVKNELKMFLSTSGSIPGPIDTVTGKKLTVLGTDSLEIGVRTGTLSSIHAAHFEDRGSIHGRRHEGQFPITLHGI